jgi:putative molybdopterin biosynthesis protein
MAEDRDLTPEQVADILQIHIQTVYDLLRSGELDGYKIGRHWRIEQAALKEYKENKKKSPRNT